MPDAEDVITAARARAAAMSERDDGRLRELLHPCFTWTSHQGERFDLDSYLQSNQHGVNTWVDQELRDPEVQVVGDTAVLTSVVRDRVHVGSGRPETFVMPMTQTWVRRGGRWVCLAGYSMTEILSTLP